MNTIKVRIWNKLTKTMIYPADWYWFQEHGIKEADLKLTVLGNAYENPELLQEAV